VSVDTFAILCFFSEWEANGSSWRNELNSFRGSSVEELQAYTLALPLLKRITPTPVFITVNTKDTNTDPEMSMKGYAKLSVRKELCLVEGEHYEVLGKKLGPLLESRLNS
jgi:hypothetical protein